MENKFLVSWNNDYLGPAGTGKLLEILPPGNAIILKPDGWLCYIPVQCIKVTHIWMEIESEWVSIGEQLTWPSDAER